MSLRAALLGVSAALALGIPAAAQQGTSGGIAVAQSRIFAAGPAARTAAAYFLISNEGEAADRLIGVESDAAQMLQLHTTEMTDGVARMRALPELAVPPGETIRLERGGTHVMLMGLTAPPEAGETLALTLVFERAGPVALEVPVDFAMDRGHDAP